MRPSLPFIALSALASVPAGAQSIILPTPAHAVGPNAQAAQRPLGPNTQLAERTTGPNTALARAERRSAGSVHYPSCSAAAAVRATPIRLGEPGYARQLDPNGDEVACE